MRNWRIWAAALALVATAGVGAGWLAQAGLSGGYVPLRIIAALLTAVLVITDIKRVTLTILGNTGIVALLVWSILSILWSRSPTESVLSVIGLISVTLLAGVLAELGTESRPERLMLGLFSGTSVVSLLLIAFVPSVSTIVVDHPTEGTLVQPIGVFIWNSDFGFSAGLAALIAADMWLKKPRAWWLLPLVTVNLVAVWVSNSAASVVVVAAGMLALLLMSGRRIALATLASAVVAGVLGSLYMGFTQFVDFVLSLLQRSSGLTGRMNLWVMALEQAGSSPLLGHGFGLSPDYRGVSRAAHAHNGFIQVLFDRGAIGLAIFLVIFVISVVAAVRRSDRIGLALLVAVFVANFANDYLTFASLGLLLLLWRSFLASQATTGWLTHFPERLRVLRERSGFPDGAD